MNGYAAYNVTLGSPMPVSGVVTNLPISTPYRVTGGGSQYHVVKISVTGVTVVGSITAKLQTSIGGTNWVDSKTTTISANGDFYIKLNNDVTADQTFLPLLALCRVVLTTTNAGDAVTVNEVDELQER